MVTVDGTTPAPCDEPSSLARRPWPTRTTVTLLLVGAVLALFSAIVVLSMPDMKWHPAREAELEATYQTYRETGVLLVKQAGAGSSATQVAGASGLVPAAWDDDPGVYLLASLTSPLTGSASPHAGLRWLMTALVAAPLLVLPLGVARLFRSPRAGYALLLLPVVIWLTNHGTVLAGTEYGLSDLTSPTPVYALYGLAASLLFLTLTTVLVLSTFRLRPAVLVAASLAVALIAGVGNLCRSMSGIGPALAVGVLWLVSTRGRARWWRALAASAIAVAIAMAVPVGVMHAVDTERARVIGTTAADLPTAHAVWHSVYLGLSYPQPLTGQPSPFGITWSDEFGWQKAQAVDPTVVPNSSAYDAIMRHLYAQEVRAHPWTAVRTYAGKAAFIVQHFAAMLVVVIVGLAAVLLRGRRHRPAVARTVAVAGPTVALGLVPGVLVMPLLYYFSELSAALGLLVAVAIGGTAWALDARGRSGSPVSQVRIARQLRDRLGPARAVPDHRSASDTLAPVGPESPPPALPQPVPPRSS